MRGVLPSRAAFGLGCACVHCLVTRLTVCMCLCLRLRLPPCVHVGWVTWPQCLRVAVCQAMPWKCGGMCDERECARRRAWACEMCEITPLLIIFLV